MNELLEHLRGLEPFLRCEVWVQDQDDAHASREAYNALVSLLFVFEIAEKEVTKYVRDGKTYLDGDRRNEWWGTRGPR
jgi:hypothetical protein